MRHIPITLAASVIALVSTTAAIAGPGPYFGPPGHRPPPHSAPWEGWIAPLVTGTVIGAVIASEPRTVVVERPLPPQPVEQTSDTIYKRIRVYIPECNCYRTYDVPIN